MLGAAFIGVASASLADTTVAHCIGPDRDTEIEVTISFRGSTYLPVVVRETKLSPILENESSFLAINANASRFQRVDTYGEAPDETGEVHYGFGLAIRNHTGYG